jgi:hypothetical protein
VSRTWAVPVPPAETTLRCGPNRHRLRWEAGRLAALDHADPDGEAVLVALGGAEPACVAVLRHWRDHAADPRVLVLGARHPGESVAPGAEDLEWARNVLRQRTEQGQRSEQGRRRVRSVPTFARASSGDPEADFALLSLLSLDAPVQRRLQSEVAANLAAAGGGPESSAWAVIEAATVGRLLPVLRRWAGMRRYEISIGAPGCADGPAVAVSVGPQWLAQVWGPYLAVVDGHLVLEVHDADDVGAEVTALRAPGEGLRRLRVRGPAPWHLGSADVRSLQAGPEP